MYNNIIYLHEPKNKEPNAYLWGSSLVRSAEYETTTVLEIPTKL